MMDNAKKTPLMTRLVEVFLRGDVAILLVAVSLVLGLAALWRTPREEEPQIVVPMADVFVSAPGLSAEEVERKITIRLERLLYQIDGVEYVYSMSRPGECIVTVRFYVGEDRENSIVKLYNKVQSNVDQVPPAVASWVVKPVEVDDVPIVNVTLWSDRSELYSDHELRRLAEQLQNELESIPKTNIIRVIGGRPRRIRVELDPVRLAGRQTSALQVAQALQASNVQLRAGQFEQQNMEGHTGVFLLQVREHGVGQDKAAHFGKEDDQYPFRSMVDGTGAPFPVENGEDPAYKLPGNPIPESIDLGGGRALCDRRRRLRHVG